MAVYDDQKERTLGNQESLSDDNPLIPQGMSVEGAGHTLANEASDFLSGLESGSQPDGTTSSSEKAASPEGLKAAETAAGTSGDSGGGLGAAADKVGKGFTGSAAGAAGTAITLANVGKALWSTNKRKRNTLLGGGGIGALIGGVFFLMIASGPGQLVQLSHILQHDFTKSQSDSQSRTSKLLRDFKSVKEGDYRYSRVGYIGAKIMSKVVGQFEDAGVNFTGSDLYGRPTGIEINRPIVEENFPETKGMSTQEFDSWLNDKFSVGSGSSFTDGKLDISGLKSQAIRGFISDTSTKILGDSAAVSAVKTRSLKAFFGLDSIFHPFSRALQNKIAATAADIQKQKPSESAGEAENEAAAQVNESNFQESVNNLEAPGEASFTTASDEENSFSTKYGSKLLPGAGLLWATGCTLQGVSGAIVSMNRNLIVLPAAVEASSLIGQGAQVENGGSDVTMEQVGATVRSFTNSAGQSIWSSPALQATESSSQANALPASANQQVQRGLSGEYQQAFGTNTTASTLKNVGNLMLSWFPFPSFLPGGKCGTLAAVTIVVAGAITQIAIAVGNAPDGEVGDAALNAAAQAGEDVAKQTILNKLLSPAINNVVDRIAKATVAPKLTLKDFSGGLGGTLIADGARAASNMSSILNGGISLGNNASTIIGDVGHQEQQQFRSESAFARIFDINDYRSLTGHLATEIDANSLAANFSSGINLFSHLGSTLSSLFGSLIPKVSAASNSDSWSGNFDWGFPQYGLPNNMLQDPALSDPYQNLEAVGKYFSSVCTDGSGNISPTNGACGGDGGYSQRIMDCFGNSLNYSPDSDLNRNVWDVVHTANATSSDVNPVSDTYQNANCGGICPDTIADCNNPDEENWEKIVMFVFDANNIKSLDCLAGTSDTAAQSCSEMGFDSAASSTQASSVTSNKVYVVGDSLTVGMRDSGGLADKLTSAGWNPTQIEATVGDTINAAIPKVNADADNVKSAGLVVVGLGTNDYSEPVDTIEQEITTMVNTIKTLNPNAKIDWINAYSKNLDMTNVNTAIQAEAASDGYTIIDWTKEVTSNPGKYTFDPTLGVHLEGNGYDLRSTFVVSNLGAVPPAATQ